MKLVFPGGEHPQVLLNPGVNRVGSDPDGTVVLDRPGVQARHCELVVGNNRVMLQALPGAETSVNGRAVEGVIALRPGDSVGIDGVQARLAGMAAVVPAAVPRGDALPAVANEDPGMLTTVRPVVPRYVLRCVSGAGLGRSYPIGGTTTVGRAAECALQLDEAGLSRVHARLLPADAGIRVEDLGSTNGTFVNGRRIQAALAGHGDEIGFDAVRFRLLDTTRSELEPVAAGGAARFRLPLWWWAGLAATVLAVAWVVLALR